MTLVVRQDKHDEAYMKEHFQLMINELLLSKEDVKLKVNRAEQITEQIRDELTLTKEELAEGQQG